VEDANGKIISVNDKVHILGRSSTKLTIKEIKGNIVSFNETSFCVLCEKIIKFKKQ